MYSMYTLNDNMVYINTYRGTSTHPMIYINSYGKIQKQFSRSVLRKRCSENMLQIYRKTLITKCDFNKVALDSNMGVLL